MYAVVGPKRSLLSAGERKGIDELRSASKPSARNSSAHDIGGGDKETSGAPARPLAKIVVDPVGRSHHQRRRLRQALYQCPKRGYLGHESSNKGSQWGRPEHDIVQTLSYDRNVVLLCASSAKAGVERRVVVSGVHLRLPAEIEAERVGRARGREVRPTEEELLPACRVTNVRRLLGATSRAIQATAAYAARAPKPMQRVAWMHSNAPIAWARELPPKRCSFTEGRHLRPVCLHHQIRRHHAHGRPTDE